MVLLLRCIHILPWYPVNSSINCMEILIYKTLLLGASLHSFSLLLSGDCNILQRIKEAFIQRIDACQWLEFVDGQNNGILLKKKACPQERCWKDIEINHVSLFMDPIVFWADKMPYNFRLLRAVLILGDSNFTNQRIQRGHYMTYVNSSAHIY